MTDPAHVNALYKYHYHNYNNYYFELSTGQNILVFKGGGFSNSTGNGAFAKEIVHFQLSVQIYQHG